MSKIAWTRWEILGTGGFGFVSKAQTHPVDGRHHLPPVVAVKSAKISESKSLSKEKKLLEDQFKTCPCILRCFGDDFTTENGEQLYNILLEYASGGCLVDLIQSTGLPENAVRNYTKSMLTALSHIHKLGYVHCDVKPHNVLLVKEAEDIITKNNPQGLAAKLADFGSVKKCSCSEDKEEEEEGGFRGTVLYAAPESISRQEYLPESDVWAVGCTVLHMLTGKSPWKIEKTENAKDVLFKIGCSNKIPDIPTKISKEAKDFLMKCFVKDPRARCRADVLLSHPFVVKTSSSVKQQPYNTTGNCSNTTRRRHHHHHFSERLHSLVPHCFHAAKSVHAC